MKKNTFISMVEGFEGKCYPVWINTNEIDLRFSRAKGVTGFFKLIYPPTEMVKKTFQFFKFKITIEYEVKKNDEFHGMIVGNKVLSTKGF
jgi:hypothetical protein